jgi:hypothetical protein
LAPILASNGRRDAAWSGGGRRLPLLRNGQVVMFKFLGSYVVAKLLGGGLLLALLIYMLIR